MAKKYSAELAAKLLEHSDAEKDDDFSSGSDSSLSGNSDVSSSSCDENEEELLDANIEHVLDWKEVTFPDDRRGKQDIMFSPNLDPGPQYELLENLVDCSEFFMRLFTVALEE